MGGFRRDRDGTMHPVEIPTHSVGICHSDGRYSRGSITSRRTPTMPAFEMTPAEIRQYGDNLTIWQKLLLIQAWAPLLTFGQRLLAATDPYAKSLVVSECCEWLASKTDARVDDELVRHLAALIKTDEGEAFVKWIVAKVEGLKA